MTVADVAAEVPRSRAEQVRQRRTHVGRPVERTAEAPPRRAPRTKRPRRVLELAVPAEIGAGLRLPSLPAFRFGSRLLSVSMTAVILVVLVNTVRPGKFTVEAATVSPTEMLTESQVRSIAEVDGLPTFAIDPQAVRARLLAQPEIQSAQVAVRWPNRVDLTVEERRPMIEWDDGGRVWWLSADGVAFLKHGDQDNLIRITASEPVLKIQRNPLAPVIAPEALWSAAALLVQVPEVEGLQYYPDHGFGFIDSQGWKAYFGVGGDMVLKVQLYRKIREVLVQRGIAAEVVSVEDPAAPYYRVQ